jgi:hypothetical protein
MCNLCASMLVEDEKKLKLNLHFKATILSLTNIKDDDTRLSMPFQVVMFKFFKKPTFENNVTKKVLFKIEEQTCQNRKEHELRNKQVPPHILCIMLHCQLCYSLLGPRDYCIGSNFWKFYLTRTGFT